jgi:hypothetical protein
VSVPLSTQQFAEKPNRFMPRTQVRLDKVIATQRYLNPEKVADIARQPASAMSSDPIVHPFKGKYFVGDGHHRIGGAIDRGDTHIWVRRAK